MAYSRFASRSLGRRPPLPSTNQGHLPGSVTGWGVTGVTSGGSPVAEGLSATYYWLTLIPISQILQGGGAVSTAESLESAVTAATASYERCQQSPDFFKTFYEQLLGSDPAIPPMFTDTEFPRQHKLLQHGLGLLLSFARRRNPGLLERLAHRHGPTDLDITRDLYAKFTWALLEAVRIHDASWGPDVERAWRDAVEPGIRFMAEHGR